MSASFPGWRLFFGVFALVAAARGETLTVATYNVQNYVAADRMTPDGFRPAYPKPEGEKRALRAVIRAADADLLFLQEMGPAPYLEELRADLRREGLDYPYLLVLEGPDPDRHVAMLARRRPITVKRHAAIPIAYLGRATVVKRGMLEATFATAAGELTIFAVHLKSRLTEEPDDPESAARRAAEAGAVRDVILRRFPLPEAGRFLILGDCNDSREGRAVQALERRGRLDVARLLPVADSRGEAWTYYYRIADSYSRVDHILVSERVRPSVQGGAARIIDIPESRQASDHRAVVVTLELRAE